MYRDADQAMDATALASHIAVLRRTALPDKSYVLEFTKFKTWVVANREAHDLDAALISRRNVDTYFVHVVTNRHGNRNTIGRISWAIQWYADYRELPSEGFKVDSPTVKHCVTVQQALFKSGATCSGKAGTDPHRGLKDFLPEPDRRKLIKHIYDVRQQDWGPCSMSFTWGQQAAVRDMVQP